MDVKIIEKDEFGNVPYQRPECAWYDEPEDERKARKTRDKCFIEKVVRLGAMMHLTLSQFEYCLDRAKSLARSAHYVYWERPTGETDEPSQEIDESSREIAEAIKGRNENGKRACYAFEFF